MAANTKFKQSLKYLGGIILHGLEYVIRHEVVLYFSSTNSLFTIFVINIGFKIKVDQGVILVDERVLPI